MYHLFHFEARHQPLAGRSIFARRLARNTLWGLAFLIAGLIIGMAGYAAFEGMGLVDAFVNAAMILSTMGPMQPLTTTGGKVFAGIYALLSGVFIFAIAGTVLAPVFHRMMHKFHLQDDAATSQAKKGT